MRLHEFNKMALSHGLSLSCLGSIVDQSIAGAISTATHSTGVGYGNLSTFVRSVTLVTADASVVTLSNDQGHDVFKASLCSLGLLGVITRVEFCCEESFNLEEELFSVSWDYFIDNFQHLAECDEHVRFWWFPQVREVKVSRFRRTKKPPTPKPSPFEDLYSTLINGCLHPVALALGRWFPDVLPHHAKLMYNLVHRPPYPKQSSSDPVPVANRQHPAHPFNSHTAVAHRVAPGPDVFVIDCGPPQYTFEGVVPYARSVEALKSIDAWFAEEGAKKGGLRPHFPVEIRPTKRDDIWLSPTYGMDGTYIGIMRYRHVPP